MSRVICNLVLLPALGCLGALAQGFAADAPADEFAQKATWSAPTLQQVQSQALAWLKDQKVDAGMLDQAGAFWSIENAAPRLDLLDRLAATAALSDAEARALVRLCSQPRGRGTLPSFAWLTDEKRPALVRFNLRLLYGRWLAQNKLYDEAAEQLATLDPADVVDPAGLLFYQGVVHHRLLNKNEGLQAIGRLLEPGHAIARRYESLARLMQADLADLKDDSLDHIARRMDDIERRLELGRANKKVRQVEDGVIASLDKLIDDMEKQQQAAAAAAAGSGGGSGPVIPASDSRIMGGRGPGEVTKKNIGSKSGWGDLPPKQRQEALQQIGKDFPAHYRDVIEQYFRKLASEESEK